MTEPERPPRKPLRERPLRFIDIESLGTEQHHPIIELAILDGEGNVLMDTKVKAPPPERKPGPRAHLPTFDPALADEKAVEYSGYYTAHIGDEWHIDSRWNLTLELDQHAEALFHHLQGCQVWGHTTQFDVWKLRRWLKLYGIELPYRFGVPCFNVESLAAEHLPFAKSFSLTSICEALGIDTTGAHTARADANMARLIHSRLIRAGKLDRWVFAHNQFKNS